MGEEVSSGKKVWTLPVVTKNWNEDQSSWSYRKPDFSLKKEEYLACEICTKMKRIVPVGVK